MAPKPFQGTGAFDVPIPPDRLFRFIADGYFENARKWDSELLEIAKTSDGPVGLGTTGRQARILPPGMRAEQDLQVVEFERDRRFAVVTTSASSPGRTTYSFEPLGAGTRLAVTFETNWPETGFFRRSVLRQAMNVGAQEMARRIGVAATGPSANI